jgi:formylglycine-generating enzyme required for sulfatase activity
MKMKTLISKSLLICLIFVFIFHSVSHAMLLEMDTGQANCGIWSTDGKATSQDGRIGIKFLREDVPSCNGNFTLSNKTGTFLGGGYSLELSTVENNATVEPLELKYLLPGLDLDIAVQPNDKSSPATAWVRGDMTMEAYAVDAAFLSIRMFAEWFGLDTLCVISEEDIAKIAVRSAPIFYEAVNVAAMGNFSLAKSEFERAIDIFIESMIDYLVIASFDCVIDTVIEKTIKSIESKTIKLSLSLLEVLVTWFPIWFIDYWATNGASADVLMLYQPQKSQMPTLTPTPTSLPTIDPAQSSFDPDEMILIPAGEFQMGCDPEHNGGVECNDDTLPLHSVYLDEYFIDKFEVTRAQYDKCVRAGYCSVSIYKIYLSNWIPDYHPVAYIDSVEAEAYCKWAGKRLPTEAEWEKAARGSSPRAFPWGDQEPNNKLANYCHSSDINECYKRGTDEVGSHLEGVSPYGVHDMAGNVAEWVSDYYLDSYYSKSPYENPKGPNESQASPMCWISGACKVTKLFRGGSFLSDSPLNITTAFRQRPWDGGAEDWGFRCVADGDYDPNSLTTPSPASFCPGSPPQRLKVGQQGKICTESDSLRLRKNPGTDGEVIASLKTGTIFEVIGGPECAGSNWSWWQVKLENGQTGWFAEGGDKTDPYFLCPVD